MATMIEYKEYFQRYISKLMTVIETALSGPLLIGQRAHEHESTSGPRYHNFLSCEQLS